MSVNTLFNNLKTALFILVILCDVVAHGQSSQASAVTKKPQSDLQQSASEVSELIATDGDRKISVEDSFSLSKGYLVKVPANHPTTPTPYSGSFEGVPNNGTMKIDMEAGFNLVGNPYPSAINVQGFINSNPSTTGTLYFLKKNNRDVAATSYATLTKTAYVSNVAKDEDSSIGYFEVGNESNWFINMAQGFFVNAATDSKLIFTNSMRRISRVNPNFKNLQDNVPNKGLYWLNLNNEVGAYSQMAVGYSAEGTMAEDQGVDGQNINLDFYLTSLIDNNEFAIQGRDAFTTTDIVPLSYKVETSGNYTIAIDHAAGIFKNNSQTIYIKDNVKHKLHNLNSGVYSFFSKAGAFVDRFEIVYEPR
jgi:hypothetical protein